MLNTADGRQTVPQTVLPDYHLVKGHQAPRLRSRGRCRRAGRTLAKPSSTARRLGTEHRRLAAARIAARLRIDLLGRAEIV